MNLSEQSAAAAAATTVAAVAVKRLTEMSHCAG